MSLRLSSCGESRPAPQARDQRQHLTFPTGEQHRRRAFGLTDRRVRQKRGTQCPRHRRRLTGPGKVRVALEWDQHRALDACRKLTQEVRQTNNVAVEKLRDILIE